MTETPHHARSGEDGRFEIRGVPPGTWSLRAWHERLGEKTFKVDVLPGAVVDVGALTLP